MAGRPRCPPAAEAVEGKAIATHATSSSPASAKRPDLMAPSTLPRSDEAIRRVRRRPEPGRPRLCHERARRRTPRRSGARSFAAISGASRSSSTASCSRIASASAWCAVRIWPATPSPRASASNRCSLSAQRCPPNRLAASTAASKTRFVRGVIPNVPESPRGLVEVRRPGERRIDEALVRRLFRDAECRADFGPRAALGPSGLDVVVEYGEFLETCGRRCGAAHDELFDEPAGHGGVQQRAAFRDDAEAGDEMVLGRVLE
jgi:hypothetical protein